MNTKGIIITMVCACIFNAALYAQPDGRSRQVSERVSNIRLNEVGKRMRLERERVEQMRPIYLQFEQERRELMDEKFVKAMQVKPDSLTEEQAEQLFFNQMEKARRTIALREKYFKEFRSVLSPREIMEFIRIENEVNKRMMRNIRQRFHHPE